jgi:hypothetical protein
MPNHLKFCGCKTCRKGRHRPGAKSAIRKKVRGFRHAAKQALKQGREPPDKTSVGYTD